ncbi:hypothetical protein Adu01nite_33600 [Paractinoplanes durhamensis]|uniref:Excreted virulence factor EspC (Type VII ESX diderm) n=1 Tax=Paractinoplanes durhamensis TaxID=113563 RepID=A0ABQ3YWP3_9ACTN|nr:hypothetical protein Adu01nite_33600 [Actinoplanes durhamensis]
MSGFEVQIGQLRGAAKAAGSAADQARVVRPGAGLDVVAGALPGGVVASKVGALGSTFNERGAGWAEEIDRWSKSVTGAADSYEKSDDSAKAAFGK